MLEILKPCSWSEETVSRYLRGTRRTLEPLSHGLKRLKLWRCGRKRSRRSEAARCALSPPRLGWSATACSLLGGHSVLPLILVQFTITITLFWIQETILLFHWGLYFIHFAGAELRAHGSASLRLLFEWDLAALSGTQQSGDGVTGRATSRPAAFNAGVSHVSPWASLL